MNVGEGSELPEEGNVLLFLLGLFGSRAGERLAEAAPGLTAALAERAVRARVLSWHRLFLHLFIICARG